MPTGVVKKWNGDRGFGFIAPDDGSEDVFVHMKCLQDGNDYLTEGEAVEYEQEFDEMKGKMKAISCTGGYNGGGWTPQPRKGGYDKGGYGKGGGKGSDRFSPYGFGGKGGGKTKQSW